MSDHVMNPAFEMPLDYDISDEFNYSSWTANTELMLTNVPWNSDYRDVPRMSSQAALDTWLNAQPNVKLTSTVQKFDNGIVKVDLPINKAMKFNYLRARNGPNPTGDVQRNYYYFITGVRYGSPDTTYLSIQLDVPQTFLYEVTFGNCYVSRGHLGIANTRQMDAFGREYLTVPEGLDLGGEYRTVHVEFEQVMSPVDTDTSDPGEGYDVLVASTLDLTQDPGTLEDPHIDSSPGSIFQGLPSGASFYIFPTGYDLATFFLKYKSKPWITQGIISITLIPNMRRYVENYSYGTNLSTDPSFKFYAAKGDPPQKHTHSMLTGWRGNQFIRNILGADYDGLLKFLTFPYMALELTTWTGSPIVIKPEAWQDPDATVVEMAALMPPGQRVAIMPKKYNWDAETASGTQGSVNEAGYEFDDFGDFLDFAVGLQDFPQLPVVNNSAIAFLANNKNGLAFQAESADWSQQRAMMSAQAGVDVANAGIGNTARQAGIANTASSQAAIIAANSQNEQSAVRSLAAGATLGMSKGGIGSLGSGGIGAGADAYNSGVAMRAALEQNTVSISARGQSAVSDITTAGDVRDTNATFARSAAKGDYERDIAGINAKVQDARMLQPSTSGQFGGQAFNLINGKFGYALRWKMPNLNALRTVGNYWLRYGYAVQQFVRPPADMHCMTKFTYWKLSETYISQGAFPEGFRQALRGIFEKGVTVWKNPSDIGNTNLADNAPLPNISY